MRILFSDIYSELISFYIYIIIGLIYLFFFCQKNKNKI